MTARPRGPAALDRDIFMRRLLRDLAGTLQAVVGQEAAEGHVGTVGARMGQWIDGLYRERMGRTRLSAGEVAQVCTELKSRIGGDFRVVEQTADRIVFGNSACPFGEMVEGRTALCMMTSNVFGRIAADNLGYSRVELKETIAAGHGGCHIVVHLRPDAAGPAAGREYYRVEADPKNPDP